MVKQASVFTGARMKDLDLGVLNDLDRGLFAGPMLKFSHEPDPDPDPEQGPVPVPILKDNTKQALWYQYSKGAAAS